LQGALALSGGGSDAAVAENPGDLIGPYQLLEKIGEGGCGVVYLAEQEEPIRRQVALKVVKLGMDTRQVIGRFEVERQVLALMDHPSIARVLDAGATVAGRPYFVMELVHGIKITDYCDQHNLSTSERLDLFMQVCHAVQHAHQKGIIHRDLKPSNVLVTLHDGLPVPKVIDFGIAKATQQPLADQTSLTAFQQFLGTPAYMSPEQAGLSGLDIDTRSDIYALGVLLYELLTGHLPFERSQLLQAGLDEMRRLIREQEPPRPSTRLSTLAAADLTTVAKQRHAEAPKLINLVRGDLDWIVMKCLEKDRTRRYETPNGLAGDLERHLNHEPVTAAAPSAFYRLRKFIRRHRNGVATATALVVVLISATFISLRLTVLEKKALNIASVERDAAKRAQKAEATERQRAQASEMESRRRLVRMNLANGARFTENGDWTGALLWFLEAMQLDERNSHAEDMHRFRIGSTLLYSPRLLQMWFPEGPVTHAEFTPDGRWLVTVGGGNLKIWEIATGRSVSALISCRSLPAWPMLSADGRRVVTVASEDQRTVRVWEIPTGEPMTPTLRHAADVISALIAPDGKQVFTVCPAAPTLPSSEEEWRSEIHIWDVATGREVRPPLRCKEMLLNLALSSNGRWLAAVGATGSAIVWDLRVARAFLFEERMAGEVTIVPPLNPTPGQSDVPAERLLPDIPPHPNWRWPVGGGLTARTVEFSPDGNRVLFACSNGIAQVWSLNSFKRLHVLVHNTSRSAGENSSVEQATFSPDGQRVLTVGSDGYVRSWDGSTGRPLGRFSHQSERFKWAGFSPDGRWFVTVAGAEGHAQEVQIWDANTGEPQSPAFAQTGWMRQALFSPDGACLLTVGVDDAIRLWSLTSSRSSSASFQHPWEMVKTEGIATGRHEPTDAQETNLRGNSRVNYAEFNSDGRRVVTVSDNGSAKVWDAITGAAITPYVRLDKPLQGAVFSDDGRYFATVGGIFPGEESITSRSTAGPTLEGEREGVACVWDANTGQPVTPAIRIKEAVRSARFSPDGRWLLTQARRAVWLWDAQTGLSAGLPIELALPLNAIAFSRDGQLIAACGRSATTRGATVVKTETRLYDARSGRPITSPLLELGEVTDLQFSPNSRWLVTVESEAHPSGLSLDAGYDVRLRVWDAKAGQPVSPRLRPPRNAGPPALKRYSNEILPILVFSSDSSRFSVWTADRVALVWDIASSRLLTPIGLPDQRAILLTQSSDGTRLLSLRGERTLQLWDATTGEPSSPPLQADVAVISASISPEGTRLLVVGGDRAQLLPLYRETRNPDEVMRYAQLLSGRQLNGSGGIIPLPASVLSNLWQTVRAEQIRDFMMPPGQLEEWRVRTAARCEREQQWFAAAFHLEQLSKNRPIDEGLRRRYRYARDQVALEALK
jgi:WD40 repeat protein/serine/threonine protein kinase